MEHIEHSGKHPISEEEIDDGSLPASDPPSRTLGTNHIVVKDARITTPETLRTNRETYLLSRPVDRNDHMQGNDSAVITLLMYGAYECPHCVEGNRIVNQIQGQFGEHLRFVFRHFPRTNVHPHAEAAAEVAEAAGEQNKFWEMHDTLFENYNRLDGEHLIGYAEALGLDMERFDRAVTERVFAQRVREDLISGYESGVSGTPAYFINGLKHQGSGQYETLAGAIDSCIAEEENVRRIQA